MANIIRPVTSRLENVLHRFALLSFNASLASFDLTHQLSGLSTDLNAVVKDRSISSSTGPESSHLKATELNPPNNSYSNAAQGRGARSFLPIIFIHQSNSDYLKYSLAQANSSNPNSTIYLLGDTSNNVYDFVDHRLFSDYFQGSAQFKTIYRHYSTHGFYTELFWFQRWFILREFLHANDIEQCLYLDSDTMLYADVTEDCKKFDQFDFTLCWNTIGCVFFLNRLEGLDAFCQFVVDIYSKKDKYHYDKMISHYAVRRRNHLNGGAGDMTALQLYSQVNFGRVGEASHIINGSFYDPDINMPHPGFEMDGGIKKVIWKDRQPYGRHLRTGEEIRFNSMHFQGAATKKLMGQYCIGDCD